MSDGGWEWLAGVGWIRECDIISRVFYASLTEWDRKFIPNTRGIGKLWDNVRERLPKQMRFQFLSKHWQRRANVMPSCLNRLLEWIRIASYKSITWLPCQLLVIISPRLVIMTCFSPWKSDASWSRKSHRTIAEMKKALRETQSFANTARWL